MGDFCYLGEWFEVCANTGTPNQHQIALFGSTNLSPRQDTLRTRHATHTPHTRHTRIHTRIHTRTSCQDVCNHLWKRTSGAAAAFVTSAAHCTNDNNHLHLPRLTGAARAQPSPHQVRLNCRVEGGVKCVSVSLYLSVSLCLCAPASVCGCLCKCVSLHLCGLRAVSSLSSWWFAPQPLPRTLSRSARVSKVAAHRRRPPSRLFLLTARANPHDLFETPTSPHPILTPQERQAFLRRRSAHFQELKRRSSAALQLPTLPQQQQQQQQEADHTSPASSHVQLVSVCVRGLHSCLVLCA